MYLEIKDLTQEELQVIEKMLANRVRAFNIYEEMCKIEIECTLDSMEITTFKALSDENKELVINKLASILEQGLGEHAFSELSDASYNVVNNHLDNLVENM